MIADPGDRLVCFLASQRLELPHEAQFGAVAVVVLRLRVGQPRLVNKGQGSASHDQRPG